MDINKRNREKSLQADYLPYDLPYLTDELEKRANLELFEDEITRVHSLKTLKSSLTDESLQKLDEEIFLLAFLRAKKFDLKRALNCMTGFCSAKRKHKELFQDFKFSDVLKTCSENSVGFFPYRYDESCCIVYWKIENWNPAENSFGEIIRVVTCGILYSLLSPSTQVAGIKFILDFKGFGLNKLTYLTPRYLFLFADGLQNCLPIRVRGFYVVNENRSVPYLWIIAKQMMSGKMRDRFHFFGKDMSNLHKHISSKILPEDLAGELPPFNNNEWVHKMSLQAEYIMRMLCDERKTLS